VNVLLIVNLDSDSGSACLKKAQTAGIKTIDYDRLTLGGGASYYVSFDNVGVGKLMGEGLQKCLTNDGKTSANIVYINGDPTDNNAALFKQGYVEALKPAIDSGKYKLVGDQTGKWDATVAGTAFEQIYTQNGGKVDGVVSANDTMAQGIIARLKANNLAGKVPVTGQDATVPGLQAILAGQQCMTVYKAVKKEADAASNLAIALIKNQDTKSLINGSVKDTVLNKDVPSALQTPVSIFKDNVKDVIDDGYQKASDVCTAAYASACQAAGIS
jgi:D-xylose transport system substrate-binding protein